MDDAEGADDRPVMPVAGMTIGIRTRQDVVVVDPRRFMAAARRADGLSPAGTISHIVLGEPHPLQDCGCFLPPSPEPFGGGAETG
jgi:hypothetical protein